MNFCYAQILFLFLIVLSSINTLCGTNPLYGFTNVPLTEANFELQKPYNVPLDRHYNFKHGIRRLWVYADDKPHDPASQTQPRTEIHIQVFILYLYVY